ncbi:MAG: hypothetical protein R6U98_19310 [Pirellulaceae bacterium]
MNHGHESDIRDFNGVDLDQGIHEKTAKSIAALVGRIEILQTNEG